MSVAKSALVADASSIFGSLDSPADPPTSTLGFDSALVAVRATRVENVEQSLALVANEALHKVLVACSSEERFRRIESVLTPEFYCEYVPTLEVGMRVKGASLLDLVVADAELCSDELLKQIAERGLANSCLILADARELEELVDRHASQHTFRVLSRERSCRHAADFRTQRLLPARGKPTRVAGHRGQTGDLRWQLLGVRTARPIQHGARRPDGSA